MSNSVVLGGRPSVVGSVDPYVIKNQTTSWWSGSPNTGAFIWWDNIGFLALNSNTPVSCTSIDWRSSTPADLYNNLITNYTNDDFLIQRVKQFPGEYHPMLGTT